MRVKEEERVRLIFMGLLEGVWLRCGPAPETLLDKLQLMKLFIFSNVPVVCC